MCYLSFQTMTVLTNRNLSKKQIFYVFSQSMTRSVGTLFQSPSKLGRGSAALPMVHTAKLKRSLLPMILITRNSRTNIWMLLNLNCLKT